MPLGQVSTPPRSYCIRAMAEHKRVGSLIDLCGVYISPNTPCFWPLQRVSCKIKKGDFLLVYFARQFFFFGVVFNFPFTVLTLYCCLKGCIQSQKTKVAQRRNHIERISIKKIVFEGTSIEDSCLCREDVFTFFFCAERQC